MKSWYLVKVTTGSGIQLIFEVPGRMKENIQEFKWGRVEMLIELSLKEKKEVDKAEAGISKWWAKGLPGE